MSIGNNIYTAAGLFTVCYLMLLALLATYPASKAYAKGRPFFKWFVFGLLLLPVAFIAALAIKPLGREE